MSAEAGERARKTGDFHCAKCGEVVHVTQGDARGSFAVWSAARGGTAARTVLNATETP